MGKHTAYDLAQMQSLPLESKIIMTEQRIRGWYEHWDGQVYVSVSGGKDSQVLAHIVKSMYKDVPCVFVNTGLEYDSVREKGIDLADEVLRPKMDFVSVITNYGYPVIGKKQAEAVGLARKNIECGKYTFRCMNIGIGIEEAREMGLIMPTEEMLNRYKKSMENTKYNFSKYRFLLDAPFRVSAMCCDVMKKRSAFAYQKEHNSYPYLGTMAQESMIRKAAWMNHGCNAFDSKHPTSQPLSFWTDQDILQYIKQFNLDIADVYGDVGYLDDDGMVYDNNLFSNSMKLSTTGVDRTGCVFCMFGITQDADRFLKLKEIEPKKYDYVMRGGKFDENGMWIPHNGLGYKFVIEWINEHGNLDIKL